MNNKIIRLVKRNKELTRSKTTNECDLDLYRDDIRCALLNFYKDIFPDAWIKIEFVDEFNSEADDDFWMPMPFVVDGKFNYLVYINGSGEMASASPEELSDEAFKRKQIKLLCRWA